MTDAAKANGRSLNAEVIARLHSTFERPSQALGVAESDPKPYYATPGTNELEQQFLALFRRWGPEKQLAFLSLFN